MKLNSITAYLVVDLNNQSMADIRTDGKKCLILDDKSNGIITSVFRSGYVRGKDKIEASTQYKLVPKTGLGIYYFKLSSGDSLAVTTDDRSAALNGDILDEVEFEKLLHLLNTKQMTAVSDGQGSPVSMLYNLAEHADESKPKMDLNMSNHYGKLAAKDSQTLADKRNKPDLSKLNKKDDWLAIQILNSQKVEA